ncbi:MAG: P-II family nitrogen regulator [Candidatus Limiplasma sp.]|nr:P-II family nitrogen regulator [Clostridiales bacterium]MDY3815528.1 P-II family nitrogen regulator [Candidatus Limiplasma sp.]
MHDLCLLSVIVPRDQSDRLAVFWEQHQIGTFFSVLCQGTATRSLLNLLGLEKTEKILAYAMTTFGRAKRLTRALVSEIGLNMPGGGVAFTIPVASVAGASSLNYLTEKQEIILGEVTDMSFAYELMIAIVNRGHVDDVMDVARQAGAMGGTVLHAKGTSPEGASRFFGMSIADEKEMLMILTAAVQKKAIMRAIMDQAGIQSPAHTVMFSLPVSSVAGLKSVMAAAGQEEE